MYTWIHASIHIWAHVYENRYMAKGIKAQGWYPGKGTQMCSPMASLRPWLDIFLFAPGGGEPAAETCSEMVGNAPWKPLQNRNMHKNTCEHGSLSQQTAAEVISRKWIESIGPCALYKRQFGNVWKLCRPETFETLESKVLSNWVLVWRNKNQKG